MDSEEGSQQKELGESEYVFLSETDFTLIYPEWIQGNATGCSRLITQGDFLCYYRPDVNSIDYRINISVNSYINCGINSALLRLI